MHTQAYTSFEIVGAVTGELWWPIGEPAYKDVVYSFRRGEQRPFLAGHDTLREAVESLMRREDGDFSTAGRLTADTFLVATRRTANRETRRFFRLTNARSISDYIETVES